MVADDKFYFIKDIKKEVVYLGHSNKKPNEDMILTNFSQVSLIVFDMLFSLRGKDQKAIKSIYDGLNHVPKSEIISGLENIAVSYF